MFLAAVARPRYDIHIKAKFDRKISIWPVIETAPVKISSSNRPTRLWSYSTLARQVKSTTAYSKRKCPQQ